MCFQLHIDCWNLTCNLSVICVSVVSASTGAPAGAGGGRGLGGGRGAAGGGRGGGGAAAAAGRRDIHAVSTLHTPLYCVSAHCTNYNVELYRRSNVDTLYVQSITSIQHSTKALKRCSERVWSALRI